MQHEPDLEPDLKIILVICSLAGKQKLLARLSRCKIELLMPSCVRQTNLVSE